jgi:hypothetical protein
MSVIQYIKTVDSVGKPLREILTDYLVRYRLTLYILGGAIVALGIALNWNWITVSGLLRVVTVLPCMLMMFRCLGCGPRNVSRANEP